MTTRVFFFISLNLRLFFYFGGKGQRTSIDKSINPIYPFINESDIRVSMHTINFPIEIGGLQTRSRRHYIVTNSGYVRFEHIHYYSVSTRKYFHCGLLFHVYTPYIDICDQ